MGRSHQRSGEVRRGGGKGRGSCSGGVAVLERGVNSRGGGALERGAKAARLGVEAGGRGPGRGHESKGVGLVGLVRPEPCQLYGGGEDVRPGVTVERRGGIRGMGRRRPPLPREGRVSHTRLSSGAWFLRSRP